MHISTLYVLLLSMVYDIKWKPIQIFTSTSWWYLCMQRSPLINFHEWCKYNNKDKKNQRDNEKNETQSKSTLATYPQLPIKFSSPGTFCTYHTLNFSTLLNSKNALRLISRKVFVTGKWHCQCTEGKLVISGLFKCPLVHSWAKGFPHASALSCPGLSPLSAVCPAQFPSKIEFWHTDFYFSACPVLQLSHCGYPPFGRKMMRVKPFVTCVYFLHFWL